MGVMFCGYYGEIDGRRDEDFLIFHLLHAQSGDGLTAASALHAAVPAAVVVRAVPVVFSVIFIVPVGMFAEEPLLSDTKLLTIQQYSPAASGPAALSRTIGWLSAIRPASPPAQPPSENKTA